MKLDTLNAARINAMKNKHKLRKETISTLIDDINRKAKT